MSDDLVSEKIEIDPALGAPPLRAAEHITVKVPGSGKVVDGKGKVEWRDGHERAMSLEDQACREERIASLPD